MKLCDRSCGQVWSAVTYAGHWPNPNSLDFFYTQGETGGGVGEPSRVFFG